MKKQMERPQRMPKFKLTTERKVKKWREKDKKILFERVKERYLQYRKMKVNVTRMNPTRRRRNTLSS
jgi:hypothetical protein